MPLPPYLVIKSVIAFFITARFAKFAYGYLENYDNWKPRWKRLLAISPIILSWLFLLSGMYALWKK